MKKTVFCLLAFLWVAPVVAQKFDFTPTTAKTLSLGFSTGLLSGNGFSALKWFGNVGLQATVGGSAIVSDSGPTFPSWYSIGLNGKLKAAEWNSSSQSVVTLYGFAGGSLFSGSNTNWIGYGLLYTQFYAASLVYALALLDQTANGSGTNSLVSAGLGFGVEFNLLNAFAIEIEPFLGGLGDLSNRSFRGLRWGVQCGAHILL